MCFKEAKKDCSYLQKSYIWNLYTDNKRLPLHLVHLSSCYCFNFNFLSWASSRYLEFNHPKSGFHRSHEPVLGSRLSFIFSLHPPYHHAWLLSLWLGWLTSLSLPPSLSPLFTQSWACNRRSAKVSWVDKQMNENFVTSRFFPQTSKKDHRSRNDPGKSSTWLSDYFLDFKMHHFCSPPVSASCYFVPTASHHFLWACSWLESVGSSSVTKCHSWGYSQGCAHLEAGRGHPSCLLTSFSMGSLITQWLCPAAWQVDPRGTFSEKKPPCTRADQVLASSHLLLFHWPKQCIWPSPESTREDPHEGLSQSNTTPPVLPKYVFVSYTDGSNVLCKWVNLELINNMYWILTRGQMPWKVKAEVLVTQSCLSLWPWTVAWQAPLSRGPS